VKFGKGNGEPPRDPYYSVPLAVPADLQEIGRELSRLEESARWSSQSQFEQAKFWRGWNLWLGIPAFVLGVASGAAVLGDYAPDWIVGALALGGAALAGIMTILSAERRSDRAANDANAFHDIQVEARQYLHMDLSTANEEGARQWVRDLTQRYSEIRRGADPIMRLSYDRAGKNIREGGQSFGVDEVAVPSGQHSSAPPPVIGTSIRATPTTGIEQ
jgi:hypothetical protein